MILSRYVTAIAFVDRDRVVSFLVRRDLELDRDLAMPYALSRRGLGQSDLVLSLLRLNTRGSLLLVERILGRPIVHCPGVYFQWRVNGRPVIRHSPTIVRVVPNPRKPNTTAHARFEAAFRIGRTLEQCRVHGARKRDIRSALRREWIRVEETA